MDHPQPNLESVRRRLAEAKEYGPRFCLWTAVGYLVDFTFVALVLMASRSIDRSIDRFAIFQSLTTTGSAWRPSFFC
jgi:hypothetical protein